MESSGTYDTLVEAMDKLDSIQSTLLRCQERGPAEIELDIADAIQAAENLQTALDRAIDKV